jgi:hypothetical protein
MLKILPIREKQSVDNYPYGRLRTTAYFSIEFVKGKGFRSVFQTINPKNGRLNAEKKSTYSPFLYLVLNTDNGHYETKTVGGNDYAAINKLSSFIAANAAELQMTPEMYQDVAAGLLGLLKISLTYTQAKDVKLLTDAANDTVKVLVKIIKTGENLFHEINFDEQRIREIEVEGHIALAVNIDDLDNALWKVQYYLNKLVGADKAKHLFADVTPDQWRAMAGQDREKLLTNAAAECKRIASRGACV